MDYTSTGDWNLPGVCHRVFAGEWRALSPLMLKSDHGQEKFHQIMLPIDRRSVSAESWQ